MRILDRAQAYFYIEALCTLTDSSVTSSRRTEKRNKAVGGVARSRHVQGLAWDLVPDDGDFQKVEQMATKLGFYALVEDDHTHVQVKREDIPE